MDPLNTQYPQASNPGRSPGCADLFFAPFSCLFSLSPLVLLGGLIALVISGLYVYFNFNLTQYGIGEPDFSKLVFENRNQRVQGEKSTWVIAYEKPQESRFTGKVRNATPIREPAFPFLTHDILVTSGDFADASKVNTLVYNHKFRWKSRDQQPQGTINLLHTVAASDSIYRQLSEVRSDQQVTITGIEIDKIDAYDPQGRLVYNWHDTGCNTLLVTSVTITSPETAQ